MSSLWVFVFTQTLEAYFSFAFIVILEDSVPKFREKCKLRIRMFFEGGKD